MQRPSRKMQERPPRLQRTSDDWTNRNNRQFRLSQLKTDLLPQAIAKSR